jgi:type IV pilus assembly protein PilE
MHARNGFTLIEVMIALVIIGILAAIAIPSYNEYITRGKITEATSTLADMRLKMEQYFQDNRTYAAVAGVTSHPCTAGSTTYPTGIKYFTFSCPVNTATAYTLQMSGNAAQRMDGFVYTLTQANVQATTITAGTFAANNGWTGNAACWVIRKGGSCG